MNPGGLFNDDADRKAENNADNTAGHADGGRFRKELQDDVFSRLVRESWATESQLRVNFAEQLRIIFPSDVDIKIEKIAIVDVLLSPSVM